VLVALLAAGAYATVVRFTQGLGAATHLSDAFPWGIWIGFDVLVGVGLAAGGFVIAATVHVFRLEKYEPIARPTILTAFLGYSLVIVALMFDLGRPYRIWHPLVMWNPHSVMFEVAWCVTLYTTVLFLEFSPLVLERFGWHRPLRILRRLYVPLVIVGVLLSTLHQSSLGTLYVIAPDKLYGLWYSPLLPIFFFLSAIAGGLAMTIFESFMSYRAFGRRLEAPLLQGLARAAVVVLMVYAVFKTEDLIARGNFGLIFQITPESVLFWGEMALGVLLPMILFAVPRVRRSETGMFFAATLTIMGFVINRLNVAVTGMAASSGVRYVPSWMELAVTASIVAVGFVLFGLAVKYLPVFPEEGKHEAAPAREPAPPGPGRLRPILQPGALAALWGLLLVGVAFQVMSVRWNGASADAHARVPAPVPAPAPAAAPLALPAAFSFPQTDDSPGTVTFRHDSHVDAAEPGCGRCHGSLFAITQPGTLLASAPAAPAGEPRMHAVCGSCHDGKTAFDQREDCTVCHQ
jgi:c(7)-type cytochrome triheme protein